jgi:hypothetical protein
MVPPVSIGRAGCLDNSRMLSHTAFVPQAGPPPRCGKFLSTDTLLSIRRWDQT